MFASDVKEVEITLSEARAKVKLAEALSRLERNKDFKLLIEEEFLKAEPIRLVSNLSHPNFQKPEMQASLVSDMRAGAALQGFFLLITKNGEAARQSIIDSEEQLTMLRNGEEI